MKLLPRLAILCLLLPLYAARCEPVKILNRDLVEQEEDGSVWVTFPYYDGLERNRNYFENDGKLYFARVKYKNSWRSISRVISFDSFDYFRNTEAFKKNELMREYLDSLELYERLNIADYLVDEKYVYLYRNSHDEPEFFVVGNVENFEYLAGRFARYEDDIYCDGNLMKGVDAPSFKVVDLPTMEVIEGVIFAGFDKNNIYLGCVPASSELLEEWNISEADFRKKYEN